MNGFDENENGDAKIGWHSVANDTVKAFDGHFFQLTLSIVNANPNYSNS